MDVIRITPEELRITAKTLRDEARFVLQHDHSTLSPSKAIDGMVKTYRAAAGKFSALADKLEADKREALEFIPAKGVQA